MGKLKLDLDDLQVESFDTAMDASLGDGTVYGQTPSGADESCGSWGSCGTTCAGQPATCTDNGECDAASQFGTVCVTGCRECPC